MPTSVALSPHFEAFIREQIESGRFSNVSEVVRAGLRLLEDQQRRDALQLEVLRAAIAEGVSSGTILQADEVFDRLEAKYRGQAKDKGR